MDFGKFLYFERVRSSSGANAIVHNYFTSNGFLILYAIQNGEIRPGDTITGESSGFSKTLSQFDYSTVDNLFKYERESGFAWQADVDLFIYTDDGQIITVIDNGYPAEVSDYQLDEAIVQR